jgi:hypothetical protein
MGEIYKKFRSKQKEGFTGAQLQGDIPYLFSDWKRQII